MGSSLPKPSVHMSGKTELQYVNNVFPVQMSLLPNIGYFWPTESDYDLVEWQIVRHDVEMDRERQM